MTFATGFCRCSIPALREGHKGHPREEAWEGTMFCASGLCPDEGEVCENTPDTPQRLEAFAAWRAWRLRQHEAWLRYDLPVRNVRHALETLGEGVCVLCGAPDASSTGCYVCPSCARELVQNIRGER